VNRNLVLVIVCLFGAIIFSLMALLPPEAMAQEDVTTRYPKYRLFGVIQLIYNDYSNEISANGKTAKVDAKEFEQYYQLGVRGYIVHPKLALYSAAVGFRYRTLNEKDDVDIKSRDRQFDYSLALSLLRAKPYVIDLYAERSTGTVTGTDTSTGESLPLHSTSNAYGASLRLSLKDLTFIKQKAQGKEDNGGFYGALPLVTLRYNHWDYSSDATPGTRSTDTVGFDLRGRIRSINTQYSLWYEYQRYSGPDRDFNSQLLGVNTATILSPGKTLLSTALQYSSLDAARSLTFNAALMSQPTDRFSQGYDYSYFYSEVGPARADVHQLEGRWSYLFTNRLSGMGHAFYYRTSGDGETGDEYGTGASLYYSRPVNDLRFTSGYDFAYRHTLDADEVLENHIHLRLHTTKLKWGRAFADYSFAYETITNHKDNWEQVFTTGVTVNGPGRLYWSLEGEYYSASNGGTNIVPGPHSTVLTGATRIKYYSLYGTVGYPLGRSGSIAVEGDFTDGSADSRSFKKQSLMARINYRFFRNLYMIAWWREGRDSIEGIPDSRITEYEGRLYYRLRMVFLSLEYRRWKIEEGLTHRDTKTLTLKLTRPI
jgi:hypothetical protein